jgi:hypothetical protein
MMFVRRLVPAALVLVAAASVHVASVYAADEASAPNPQPTAVQGQAGGITSSGLPSGAAVAGDPAAGIPDLPANQAEIEALRSGAMILERPAATDAAAPADAARVERRAAFDAVIGAQQQKIQALTDRLASVVRNEDAVGIQKEIEREKLSTQRQLLDLQLAFATRDGDQARIDQLQAALATWDAPRPAMTSVVDRPVPSNPVR